MLECYKWSHSIFEIDNEGVGIWCFYDNIYVFVDTDQQFQCTDLSKMFIFLFQVTLPHGAKVEVKESFSNFVNVWVVPAAADFNNTQGNPRDLFQIYRKYSSRFSM